MAIPKCRGTVAVERGEVFKVNSIDSDLLIID
jgi:hypothetical protein